MNSTHKLYLARQRENSQWVQAYKPHNCHFINGLAHSPENILGLLTENAINSDLSEVPWRPGAVPKLRTARPLLNFSRATSAKVQVQIPS